MRTYDRSWPAPPSQVLEHWEIPPLGPANYPVLSTAGIASSRDGVVINDHEGFGIAVGLAGKGLKLHHYPFFRQDTDPVELAVRSRAKPVFIVNRPAAWREC